jgi:hypothetical protein
MGCFAALTRIGEVIRGQGVHIDAGGQAVAVAHGRCVARYFV